MTAERTAGPRRSTRRAFLRGAGRAGAAGLALTLVRPRGGRAQEAAGPPPGVLCARILHEAPRDFAASEGRGQLLRARADAGLAADAGGAIYESARLALAFAATHVGLQWTATGRSGAELELDVRTSGDGQEWAPWATVPTAGARQDADGAHGYTALASVPAGTFLQYRVTFPEQSSVVLRRLTLSYLNPYAGPTLPQTAGGRPADARFPFPFRSREEWGADESLRFDPDGTESWPRMYVPVKKLVVHHTAGTNNYADAAAEVRAIYVFHAQELGWGDIGYNALIGRDGVVYEGRRGRGPARESLGRQALSPGVVAGHAFFHNYGTAGFALIGDFQDTLLPDLMRDRLVDLLVYAARQEGVDPLTRSDFLRADSVWHRDVPNLAGHRDCVVTECPGDRVYWLLPDVRAAVAARLGAPDVGRVAFLSTPPAADTTARTMAAAWSGLGIVAPGWSFSQYLERWRFENKYDTLPEDNRPDWPPYDPRTASALTDLVPGHYTLHVRGRDPLGREAVYESSVTLHVTDELLADDEDLGQTQRVGGWLRRTDGSGIYGESWEEAPAGRGERVFRWAPLVSEHGRYEVWARWPEVEGRASNALYTVVHADGVYRERRDQRVDAGAWTRLGGEQLFRFVPGRAGGVALANDADGPVAADAVKLVLGTRLG